MGLKVTFDWANKIIQVDIAPVGGIVEIDVKTDIYSDGKEDWKTDADLNKFKFPVTPVGGDALPGSKALGSTFFLEYGWVIRPYNASHTLAINGNMYARDGSDPYVDTIGTFTVRIIQSVSNLVDSTVQQLAEIENMSFLGAVWVDVLSTNSGTAYPNGNSEYPVNNIPDAVAIAGSRGFKILQIIGDLTLDTGDNVEDYKLIGVSHINSILTVNAGSQCLRTGFEQFDITGVLDGDSEIRNCIVRDLTYFNGHIHTSALVGTITLAGSNDATMTDCSILDFNNPPIIDAGGSGQDLMMSNYSGIIYVDNLTGSSSMGFGVDAGQVIINNSCTAGVIQISGTGSVVDNSGPNCYVIDSIINGTDVQNLSRLIELQRPHHTGTGNIWFWDPYGGNDAWDGKHADRATKTFAQAHTLAVDNNHDIIICVAGYHSGVTTTTEQLVITKNYLFVRGPGRDFHINCTNDTGYTIDIQGNGVEISSMLVTTESTNTAAVIHASGGFPYILDVYIENSGNGIHITDGVFGIIENTRVSHGTGYGIRLDGNSEHFTIENTHIGSNVENGIEIDLTTGHEVTLREGCIIHGNGGYGLSISNSNNGVQIGSSNSIFNNTLGQINDLDTGTNYQLQDIADNNADTIFSKDLTTYANGSAGHTIDRLKYLSFYIFINTEEVSNGNGSMEFPFNNLTDAIDKAETSGIKDLIILSDILIDRQLKNFRITGVGNPTVDTNGQILTKTEFFHCNMEGSYTGAITVQQGVLRNNFHLSGNFEKCALAGDLICVDGSNVVMVGCVSAIAGIGRPTLSMNALGTCLVSVRDYTGGFTVKDCNNIADVITVDGSGALTFDASCTAGEMVARGRWEPFVNLAAGATIYGPVGDQVKVDDVWAANFNKRDNIANVITVYEEDNITPRHVFDTNDDTSVITPQ